MITSCPEAPATESITDASTTTERPASRRDQRIGALLFLLIGSAVLGFGIMLAVSLVSPTSAESAVVTSVDIHRTSKGGSTYWVAGETASGQQFEVQSTGAYNHFADQPVGTPATVEIADWTGEVQAISADGRSFGGQASVVTAALVTLLGLIFTAAGLGLAATSAGSIAGRVFSVLVALTVVGSGVVAALAMSSTLL